jgi:hypothetical protein
VLKKKQCKVNSDKRKAYKQKCKRNKRIKKREAQNEENVRNVEQQQQLQHGAVAPSPAAASTAGPVPYPVMLGSDSGVIIFLNNFYLLPVLNASYLSDQSISVVACYGVE